MTFTALTSLPHEIFWIEKNADDGRCFLVRYTALEVDYLGETNEVINTIFADQPNYLNMFVFFKAGETVKETEDVLEIPSMRRQDLVSLGYDITRVEGIRDVGVRYYSHKKIFVVDGDLRVVAVYGRDEGPDDE